MPSHQYALEPNGPKRLVLSWTGMWKNMSVQLDGREVGVIDGKAALQQGRDFALPDGTTLHVQLMKKFGDVGLQVTRNGAPLPGSASDPSERVRRAAHVVWFVAGVTTVFGLVAVLFDVKALQNAGIGWVSLVAGAIYGALGYFTLRRSRVALILAIGLFVLDGIASLAMGLGGGGMPSSIIVRIFLLMPMIRGVSAMGESAKEKPADAAV